MSEFNISILFIQGLQKILAVMFQQVNREHFAMKAKLFNVLRKYLYGHVEIWECLSLIFNTYYIGSFSTSNDTVH